MLARQRPTDAAGQHIGLGLFMEGPAQGGRFQHGGANAGYRAYLLGHLDRPLAIAIMTNSDAGDRIFNPVIDAVRAAYP